MMGWDCLPYGAACSLLHPLVNDSLSPYTVPGAAVCTGDTTATSCLHGLNILPVVKTDEQSSIWESRELWKNGVATHKGRHDGGPGGLSTHSSGGSQPGEGAAGAVGQGGEGP